MTFCHTCRGNGFVPASRSHRWFVMDCPACGGPPETLEEQAARLRDRVRDLERQLAHELRGRRETQAEQDAALYREGALR